MVHCNWI